MASAVIRIHNFPPELYDKIPVEEKNAQGTVWKNIGHDLTIFPGTRNRSIAISIHAPSAVEYENFPGEEDNLDETYWKDARADNVTVTVFKP